MSRRGSQATTQGKASPAGGSRCKGPEAGAPLLCLRTAERSARLQQSGGPRGDQGLLGDKPPGGTPMVPGLTGPGCRGLRAGRLVGPGCPGRQLHQACPLSSEVSLWFSDCPPATAHHRTGREMGAGRRGGRQSSESGPNSHHTKGKLRLRGDSEPAAGASSWIPCFPGQVCTGRQAGAWLTCWAGVTGLSRMF